MHVYFAVLFKKHSCERSPFLKFLNFSSLGKNNGDCHKMRLLSPNKSVVKVASL